MLKGRIEKARSAVITLADTALHMKNGKAYSPALQGVAVTLCRKLKLFLLFVSHHPKFRYSQTINDNENI